MFVGEAKKHSANIGVQSRHDVRSALLSRQRGEAVDVTLSK
jgi:hypothetical protein